MRKSHSILTFVFVIFSLCASAFAADNAPAPAAGVVNLNTADAAQLANLPRIGMKAAQQIIDYRTQHGPFHKTSDLMQVKGFGTQRRLWNE